MRKLKLLTGCLLAAAMSVALVGCGTEVTPDETTARQTTADDAANTETTVAVEETEAPTEEVTEEETEAPAAQEIQLALCIYANQADYDHAEMGAPVTVTGDGQYTVTFDMATDHNADSSATSVGNFGSIYIKDYDAMLGQVMTSTIASCNIVYDSVVVDGEEMTVVDTESYECINSNGLFDTGKPMNAWDGSVIDDSQIEYGEDYQLSFAGHDDCQTVSVTFTLSDIVWAE